ncbi:MAG: hypothetical protein AAF125_12580 [Chloroflexota bacterium]
MNRIVVLILSIVILGSLFAGTAYAAVSGYGVSASESQSARATGPRGFFIIGGGPGIGGK